MEGEDNTKSGGELVYTAFRMPKDHRERLKALAAAEHRTLSGELRKLIDDRLRVADLEEAA